MTDSSGARGAFVSHLECTATGERYETGQVHNLSAAGKPLFVRYDLDAVRARVWKADLRARPQDMWRFRELLPIGDTARLSLGEITTPLIALDAIGRKAGARAPLVKDEGRLPTGSFKARGLAMAVGMAAALGVKRIAIPTNGNAGGAFSAYAARMGLEAIVFAPEQTPAINLAEAAAQGARVYRVNGLIDDCGAIVAQGARDGRWFDISTLKEPYRVEGKKTMGLELAEQLGWRMPRAIFYPTGGGTGLIGMWKAFAELEGLGWIGSERPKMFAVQSSGCAPIVRAFEAGADHAERWEDAETVASGIRVPKAIGDFLILRAVRASGGRAVAVGDPAILDARDRVARSEGLLLCPEGAATVAAWEMAVREGWLDADDDAVLFNCATGLKYPLPDRAVALDRHGAIDWDGF